MSYAFSESVAKKELDVVVNLKESEKEKERLKERECDKIREDDLDANSLGRESTLYTRDTPL